MSINNGQGPNRQGTFALWQPAYAERRIATFPIKFVEIAGKIEKKPAIRGFMKVGLRGSQQLTFRFAAADIFGFLCGPHSKIAVGDIDIADERRLADFLERHGATPIIAMTASGKYHAWYRYNGERRRIRPWKSQDLPFDILGVGGAVVAPPSKTNRGQYQFIQGSLDDIDRLPIMRNLEPEMYAVALKKNRNPRGHPDIASPMRGMREHDGRNDKLFQAIGPVAREIYAAGGTRDALFDVAVSHNNNCAEPMDATEVDKIVSSVWTLTTEHRNWIRRGGDRQSEIIRFANHVDAYCLLEFLRAGNGASASFWIANGLAEKFGWTVKRLASARDHLIKLGYIKRTKRAWTGSPASYIWA